MTKYSITKQRHMITRDSSFMTPKILLKFEMGSPPIPVTA